MKLRFHARPGHALPFPGQNTVGRLTRYIGRDSIVTEAGLAHPAQKQAIEFEHDSLEAKRVTRLMSIEEDKPLWCADQATADALGLTFVAVELKDGEYVPKSSKKETLTNG